MGNCQIANQPILHAEMFFFSFYGRLCALLDGPKMLSRL